jgi:hypothetical protein
MGAVAMRRKSQPVHGEHLSLSGVRRASCILKQVVLQKRLLICLAAESV